MLYILMGLDDFSLRESLNQIKSGLGDQSLLPVNTTVLEGQSLTVSELKNVAETVPFLAEKRLVIVTGLLGRLAAKKTASQQAKGKRTASHEEDGRAFAAYLHRLPESTVLVLVEDEMDSNSPIFKLIATKAEVRNFPLVKGAQLKTWVQRHVKEEGGTISLGAVDLLAKLVGSNLWVMKNEINKLVLFAAGRRIEEGDVTAVVSLAQEASVFAMVDAILEFKVGVAEQLLQRLLQEGDNPSHLLTMLSRQAQFLVRIREMKSQRLPQAEMQRRLGLADFAWRKALEQAERYPLARVKQIYPRLLATDLSIKTGTYDGELALNILIAELCQR